MHKRENIEPLTLFRNTHKLHHQCLKTIVADMRSLLALPVSLLLALPVLGDARGDKVHEIEHSFKNATVINGPTLVGIPALIAAVSA